MNLHESLDISVFDVSQDREGHLWFSHAHSGLTRLDTESLQRLTETAVSEILVQDKQGRLWFDSGNALCWLSDGRQYRQRFTNAIIVRGFLADAKGRLWVGTVGDGLYRYNSVDDVLRGVAVHFEADDGLVENDIYSLLEAKDGTIWVGAGAGTGRLNPESSSHLCHLCHFDGKGFKAIPTPQPVIFRLFEDSQSRIWMGGFMGGGLSCYDGKQLITYTIADGLPDDRVQSIAEDEAGNLWIGTHRGLCCFDGKRFLTYDRGHGLFSEAHQWSTTDQTGQLWFGTQGGLYRYDGRHFQILTTEDGLPSNGISGLVSQPDGSMIIATYRGIVRYTQTASVAPGIDIQEVIADQTYLKPVSVQLTTTGADLLLIMYHGMSLATRQMRYSYLLEGYDEDWTDTWESQVRYENIPVGNYTFLVIAINRDLVESQSPAILKLTVVEAPRDQQIAQLESDLEKRNRELEHINANLEAELQDAHDVQMSLMPESAPRVAGLDIAGRCVPATEVSGDFFDYLPAESSNEIVVVVGDVTGHGMRGAMNATLTDGILRAIAEKTNPLSPGVLMSDLNNVLKPRMEREMNVTMVIGLINGVAKKLTLANAGHHAHPLLVRDGTIEPLVAKGMPLGMMAGIGYRQVEFPLQSGDVLVFMTDGIIEAKDSDGKEYQDTGRLQQVLDNFTPETSAEAMVDALIKDATTFGANMTTEEEDDITVVVVS